ncbi:hypothetical protein K2Z83_19615 [Oscillochloris sp. ZM17-4]|uniref:hypothetical protein n=1 Tax=Oscillochloris sp. ZM17-4 TaxID=2866714 RepID=UPI001C733627|nr:hypothetical protein [Oscillochloris sp. ZM17-4]MBX0329876.1 hypothetical protein [Oscillochloris sp. ZM17-4]
MRFPLIDTLNLPCVFERLVPGRPHPDGRRYLPLIVLRPTAPPGPGAITPEGLLLGVVDRHHRVDASAVGRAGVARLVFALSALRIQAPPQRAGLEPEPGWAQGRASTAPTLLGRVKEVAAWEQGGAQLPYQTLYAELTIDAGVGVVGLRTSLTAEDMAAAIGAARVVAGDWVELRRSRIDVLAFEPG